MTWKIIEGDCLSILPTLTEKIDAVVTDPPYGIADKRQPWLHGEGRLLRDSAVIGDDKPFDPTPFLGFPTVVLFGANHYASRLPDSSMWLVWDKRNGASSDCCSDCEVAWTNLAKPARLFHHSWRGFIKDSEQASQRLHPTQKPIALMSWVIDMACIPVGATVLDPFCGSGTTGVACIQTGRNFIGVEIDHGYAEIARRRCEAAAMQGRLL